MTAVLTVAALLLPVSVQAGTINYDFEWERTPDAVYFIVKKKANGNVARIKAIDVILESTCRYESDPETFEQRIGPPRPLRIDAKVGTDNRFSYAGDGGVSNWDIAVSGRLKRNDTRIAASFGYTSTDPTEGTICSRAPFSFKAEAY